MYHKRGLFVVLCLFVVVLCSSFAVSQDSYSVVNEPGFQSIYDGANWKVYLTDRDFAVTSSYEPGEGSVVFTVSNYQGGRITEVHSKSFKDYVVVIVTKGLDRGMRIIVNKLTGDTYVYNGVWAKYTVNSFEYVGDTSSLSADLRKHNTAAVLLSQDFNVGGVFSQPYDLRHFRFLLSLRDSKPPAFTYKFVTKGDTSLIDSIVLGFSDPVTIDPKLPDPGDPVGISLDLDSWYSNSYVVVHGFRDTPTHLPFIDVRVFMDVANKYLFVNDLTRDASHMSKNTWTVYREERGKRQTIKKGVTWNKIPFKDNEQRDAFSRVLGSSDDYLDRFGFRVPGSSKYSTPQRGDTEVKTAFFNFELPSGSKLTDPLTRPSYDEDRFQIDVNTGRAYNKNILLEYDLREGLIVGEGSSFDAGYSQQYLVSQPVVDRYKSGGVPPTFRMNNDVLQVQASGSWKPILSDFDVSFSQGNIVFGGVPVSVGGVGLHADVSKYTVRLSQDSVSLHSPLLHSGGSFGLGYSLIYHFSHSNPSENTLSVSYPDGSTHLVPLNGLYKVRLLSDGIEVKRAQNSPWTSVDLAYEGDVGGSVDSAVHEPFVHYTDDSVYVFGTEEAYRAFVADGTLPSQPIRTNYRVYNPQGTSRVLIIENEATEHALSQSLSRDPDFITVPASSSANALVKISAVAVSVYGREHKHSFDTSFEVARQKGTLSFRFALDPSAGAPTDLTYTTQSDLDHTHTAKAQKGEFSQAFVIGPDTPLGPHFFTVQSGGVTKTWKFTVVEPKYGDNTEVVKNFAELLKADSKTTHFPVDPSDGRESYSQDFVFDNKKHTASYVVYHSRPTLSHLYIHNKDFSVEDYGLDGYTDGDKFVGTTHVQYLDVLTRMSSILGANKGQPRKKSPVYDIVQDLWGYKIAYGRTAPHLEDVLGSRYGTALSEHIFIVSHNGLQFEDKGMDGFASLGNQQLYENAVREIYGTVKADIGRKRQGLKGTFVAPSAVAAFVGFVKTHGQQQLGGKYYHEFSVGGEELSVWYDDNSFDIYSPSRDQIEDDPDGLIDASDTIVVKTKGKDVDTMRLDAFSTAHGSWDLLANANAYLPYGERTSISLSDVTVILEEGDVVDPSKTRGDVISTRNGRTIELDSDFIKVTYNPMYPIDLRTNPPLMIRLEADGPQVYDRTDGAWKSVPGEDIPDEDKKESPFPFEATISTYPRSMELLNPLVSPKVHTLARGEGWLSVDLTLTADGKVRIPWRTNFPVGGDSSTDDKQSLALFEGSGTIPATFTVLTTKTLPLDKEYYVAVEVDGVEYEWRFSLVNPDGFKEEGVSLDLFFSHDPEGDLEPINDYVKLGEGHSIYMVYRISSEKNTKINSVITSDLLSRDVSDESFVEAGGVYQDALELNQRGTYEPGRYFITFSVNGVEKSITLEIVEQDEGGSISGFFSNMSWWQILLLVVALLFAVGFFLRGRLAGGARSAASGLSNQYNTMFPGKQYTIDEYFDEMEELMKLLRHFMAVRANIVRWYQVKKGTPDEWKDNNMEVLTRVAHGGFGGKVRNAQNGQWKSQRRYTIHVRTDAGAERRVTFVPRDSNGKKWKYDSIAKIHERLEEDVKGVVALMKHIQIDTNDQERLLGRQRKRLEAFLAKHQNQLTKHDSQEFRDTHGLVGQRLAPIHAKMIAVFHEEFGRLLTFHQHLDHFKGAVVDADESSLPNATLPAPVARQMLDSLSTALPDLEATHQAVRDDKEFIQHCVSEEASAVTEIKRRLAALTAAVTQELDTRRPTIKLDAAGGLEVNLRNIMSTVDRFVANHLRTFVRDPAQILKSKIVRSWRTTSTSRQRSFRMECRGQTESIARSGDIHLLNGYIEFIILPYLEAIGKLVIDNPYDVVSLVESSTRNEFKVENLAAIKGFHVSSQTMKMTWDSGQEFPYIWDDQARYDARNQVNERPVAEVKQELEKARDLGEHEMTERLKNAGEKVQDFIDTLGDPLKDPAFVNRQIDNFVSLKSKRHRESFTHQIREDVEGHDWFS